MITRVLSAAAALVVVLPILVYGGMTGARLLVLVATGIGVGEFGRMAFAPRAWTGRVAVGLPIVAAQLASALGGPVEIAVAGALVAVWSVATLWPDDDLGLTVRDLGRAALGACWLGQIGWLLVLRDGPDGGMWLSLPLVVAWSSDTGGYFGGRWFGATPLHPRVSPKKTREGAVGSLVGAGLGAMVTAGVAGSHVSPGVWMGVGAVGAVLAIVGDLTESLLKRAWEVKDTGGLLPGHGGLLDRIDSVLFVAPWIALNPRPAVILTLASGLTMLGVLVVIHEAGHMLVAKAFGMGVPVFSVGVGPRVVGVTWRDTEYRLSALPFGGYVRLAGADPYGDADLDDDVPPEQDFMLRPVWQRLLVMVAGPAANLILPTFLFSAVLMGGEPQADNSVGWVNPSGAAFAAGLREGDRIVAAAGTPVVTWSDLGGVLAGHAGESVTLDVVDPSGTTRSVTLAGADIEAEEGRWDPTKLAMSSDRPSAVVGIDDPTSPAARVGLRTGDRVVSVDGQAVPDRRALMPWLDAAPHEVVAERRLTSGSVVTHHFRVVPGGWSPPRDDAHANPWGVLPIELFVQRVTPGGAAEAAGILAGDRLWAAGGQPITAWAQLTEVVQGTVDTSAEVPTPRPVDIEVVRAGARHALRMTPTMNRELVYIEARHRPMIGVMRFETAFVAAPEVRRYYGPVEAVERSLRTSRAVLTDTFTLFGNLATQNVKPEEGLGGPVEIFAAAGRSAELGIFAFVRMMAMISFSLGIVNLLPVPVLDGGQIVFYAIEGLRGRPLSLAVRERLQMVGVLALVALMLWVTWHDISDLRAG